MARIDDYRAAIALAREKLAAASPAAVRRRSGYEPAGGEGEALRVPFLGRLYRVALPGGEFTDLERPGAEVPLQEQVLLLHYLLAGPAEHVAGDDWVAYREIPGAGFYFGAFVRRAIDPLKKAFGPDPAAFAAAAGRLGGAAVPLGDAAFEFQALPRVPLRLVLYAGDEEFPPEAAVLFRRDVGAILPPEDIAWLAGMTVYRLIALARP